MFSALADDESDGGSEHEAEAVASKKSGKKNRDAAKGWVQQSGRRFIPGVVKHISEVGIPVVSAQEAFARSCPSGDPTDWKKKAQSLRRTMLARGKFSPAHGQARNSPTSFGGSQRKSLHPTQKRVGARPF